MFCYIFGLFKPVTPKYLHPAICSLFEIIDPAE